MKKLKIQLEDYAYSCADGCCYNYGTITTVNGEELVCHNSDLHTILIQILEHLKIEFKNDEETEGYEIFIIDGKNIKINSECNNIDDELKKVFETLNYEVEIEIIENNN